MHITFKYICNHEKKFTMNENAELRGSKLLRTRTQSPSMGGTVPSHCLVVPSPQKKQFGDQRVRAWTHAYFTIWLDFHVLLRGALMLEYSYFFYYNIISAPISTLCNLIFNAVLFIVSCVKFGALCSNSYFFKTVHTYIHTNVDLIISYNKQLVSSFFYYPIYFCLSRGSFVVAWLLQAHFLVYLNCGNLLNELCVLVGVETGKRYM